MKRKLGWLLFAIAILGYAFLYIATSKAFDCEGDCLRNQALDTLIRKNHPYIYFVNVGGYRYSYDTLNVWVKDTTGVNWNLLADTICTFASGVELKHRYIYLLETDTINHRLDTVARTQCP
jgi:hypothetical protein